MRKIIFKIELSGKGIVNYDDAKQRFYLMKHFDEYKGLQDNTKLCKKSFTENGYKVKISSDCLRKGIFQNDIECVNSSIMANDIILNTYVSSFVGLTRGYMFAYRKDVNRNGLKRKSPLIITEATQTNNAKPYMEVCSKSGERDDTSFFYNETIGDITYECEGVIDLKNLQFVSADPIHDRMAIHTDWCENELYLHGLKAHFGDIANPKIGYFTSSPSILTKCVAEKGVLLNDELVEYLTKQLLMRLMNINIERATAFAKTTSMKIKIVNDVLEDISSDEEGWIELKTINEIESLKITPTQFYHESSLEDVTRFNLEMEAYNKNVKDAKSKKKENEEIRKSQRKTKAVLVNENE